jgi:hypothetical protein
MIWWMVISFLLGVALGISIGWIWRIHLVRQHKREFLAARIRHVTSDQGIGR